MTIVYSNRFEDEFLKIYKYISIDSINRANNFKTQLKTKIKKIPNSPYIYRTRESYLGFECRELIFKGYTIPFLINNQKEEIIILGIFNQNQWDLT